MTLLSNQKILVFLILTFSLSAIFWYLIISGGTTQKYTLGLMWCPGIAAILTQLLFTRNLRNLGWSIPSAKYLLMAYVIPLIYTAIVYGFGWLTGIAPFNPEGFVELITPAYPILQGQPTYITMGKIFSGSVSGNAAPQGLFKTTFQGPELLTGGSVGMEGSLIAMLVSITFTVLLLILVVRRGKIVPPSWKRKV